LSQIKTNLDSGIFQPVQFAALHALDEGDELMDEILQRYRERGAVMAQGLRRLGWVVPDPKATFYLWVPTPQGLPSITLCNRILDETGIIVTPGVGFGEAGEGYIRFSLTMGVDRLKEALSRLEKFRF
jgi:LL-diaminopimelate aminotransferase